MNKLTDYQEHLTLTEEYNLCNFIYKKTYKNDEEVFVFADDDEYYPDFKPSGLITKTVVFE